MKRPDPEELTTLRSEYDSGTLDEAHAPSKPWPLFESWLADALERQLPEPNAMALGTSIEGRPGVRIVLLRGFDERGLVFYTNYESRKGRELQQNARAAATFFWSALHRQVRVEGPVERTSEEESDLYFSRRPRGSQLGAWASPQSRSLSDRAELDEALAAIEERFADEEDVPRPSFWGGFRLVPESFEFWQGRRSRLHDRLRYRLREGSWQRTRLAP